MVFIILYNINVQIMPLDYKSENQYILFAQKKKKTFSSNGKIIVSKHQSSPYSMMQK